MNSELYMIVMAARILGAGDRPGAAVPASAHARNRPLVFATPYIIPRLARRAVVEQLAQQDVEMPVPQVQRVHGS